MLRRIELLIKRIFDFIFAVFAGIVFFPLIAMAILYIKVVSPEDSPIFEQKRIGYKGNLFTILKLRTMTNEKDREGNLLPDEYRLKRWGKIIRATNIDELTQILNILRGEMSWIGPRPLLPREMDVMTNEEQILRQSILPGITGWEAINEEKTDTRAAMAQYDLYYVRHWSLWLDIVIFFKTIGIILFKLRPDDSLRAPKK